MRAGKKQSVLVSLLIVLSCSIVGVAGTPAKKPLSRETLVALLVGGAQAEAIVEHLHERGIAFNLTVEFKQQLKAAGANQFLLDALAKAQVSGPETAMTDDRAVIDAMLRASTAMKSGDLTAAARILSDSNSAARHPAVLFVLGEIFARQDAWARAAAIYAGLLSVEADFPDAHTKLSYASYRSGSTDEALAEAELALVETPRSPEAHKNLGLILQSTGDNDKAVKEFQEALSMKPDYASAHYDLGMLYEEIHATDSAISEYRKAIAIDPTEAEYHHHLGTALVSRKEFQAATAEFRQAARLDPQLLAARSDLAAALRNSGNVDEALAEYRELQGLMPAATFCHTCYGNLLYEKGDLTAAAAEFREAQRADTTDAEAHLGLATVLAAQHHDDEAMREYLVAEQLDPDSADTHRKAAHFYLAKHKIQEAVSALRDAVVAAPSDEKLHYELADLLASTGENESALAEYAAVVHLQPRWTEAAIRFASLLEKLGQSQSALAEYRRIAEAAPGDESKAAYEQAALRLRPQLPVTQESAQTSAAETPPVEDFDVLWRTSTDAMKAQVRRGNLVFAAHYARQAAAFAEQVNPHDRRLIESLRQLGSLYQRLNKFANAREAYLRALAVAQETCVQNCQDTMLALDDLGDLAMSLKEYRNAETYYSSAVDIARKLYTPGPERDAQLFNLANASRQQGHFSQAEALLRELVSNTTGRDPESESRLTTYAENLANVYYSWGKYQQAEAYYRQTLSLQERQFSARSPMLDRTLYQLALLMHKLGREREEQAYLHRRSAILTTYKADSSLRSE